MWISTLLILILVLIILFLWQSNMRSKELAFEAAKALCEEHHVQLFDQTVSLRQVKLKRLVDGRMAFFRAYEFDYGTDSTTRYRGKIITHGHEIIQASLKFQEGASVLNRVNNLSPDYKKNTKENIQADILEFKNFKTPANDPNTLNSNDQ